MTRPDDQGPPPECRSALQSLLVADSASLSQPADDELRRHLATCEACRLTAREFSEAQTAVDDWLGERVAARSVEEVLDRVHAEIAEKPFKPVPGAHRAVGFRRRTILSVALAAALAAIALWAASDGEGPSSGDALPIAQPASSPVAVGGRSTTEVTVSSDRRFALLETRRPTISVVWFY